MLNMPVLRLRRIGNSLGVLLPSELVAAKGLRPNDDVRVEIERVPRLEDVAGSLRKYGLSAREWNDLANEGEEL